MENIALPYVSCRGYVYSDRVRRVVAALEGGGVFIGSASEFEDRALIPNKGTILCQSAIDRFLELFVTAVVFFSVNSTSQREEEIHVNAKGDIVTFYFDRPETQDISEAGEGSSKKRKKETESRLLISFSGPKCYRYSLLEVHSLESLITFVEDFMHSCTCAIDFKAEELMLFNRLLKAVNSERVSINIFDCWNEKTEADKIHLLSAAFNENYPDSKKNMVKNMVKLIELNFDFVGAYLKISFQLSGGNNDVTNDNISGRSENNG